MDDNEVPLQDFDSDNENHMNDSYSGESKVKVGKDGLPLNVIQESTDNVEAPESPKKHSKRNESSDSIDSSNDQDLESNRHKDVSETNNEEENPPLIIRQKRFATIVNLLNSQLGAGILSVPSTFVNTGIVASIVLSLVTMGISYGCMILLLVLVNQTGKEGLPELTAQILKKPGSITLSVLNVVFLITALVAYLILGGDMITSWFELGGVGHLVESRMRHALMIFIYAILFPIMLTIPRNISFLKYFSMATVFCIIFFLIALAYKAGYYGHKYGGMEPTCKVWKLDFSIFSSLSIYGLSYAFPAVALPAIRLYNPNLRKRKIVTLWANVLCFVLVTVAGITGYLCFGASTDGNILKNFDSNDVLMIVCRCGFFVIVSCAYPMVSQSVMSMWGGLIFGNDNPPTLPAWKRAVVIVLNNIIPLVLAMFLPTAKPILSIGGALGGCIVDFIFPPLMYVVYHWNEEKKFGFKYIVLYLCIAFGAVTGAIATYQAVVDAIDSLK